PLPRELPQTHTARQRLSVPPPSARRRRPRFWPPDRRSYRYPAADTPGHPCAPVSDRAWSWPPPTDAVRVTPVRAVVGIGPGAAGRRPRRGLGDRPQRPRARRASDTRLERKFDQGVHVHSQRLEVIEEFIQIGA